jgi:serine protease Do
VGDPQRRRRDALGRVLITLLAGLALAGAPDVLAQIDAAQRALYTAVAPAVVYVVTHEGFGSGVILAPDGLVLTNAHVVGAADRVDVVTFAGQKLSGRVIERGVGTDLAVVQLDGAAGLPVLRVGNAAELAVGQWVGAVGHAAGGGWSFTTGAVSNVYTSSGGHAVFQTQIPLNHGNSGGPIVDREGRLVGIATASLERAQNLNFAIRLDVALLGLTQLEPVCECLVVHAPVGVPVFVDGAMVGTGPRVAVPANAGEHVVFAVIAGRKVERTARLPGERTVTLGL